jgi:hypothetical protein
MDWKVKLFNLKKKKLIDKFLSKFTKKIWYKILRDAAKKNNFEL